MGAVQDIPQKRKELLEQKKDLQTDVTCNPQCGDAEKCMVQDTAVSKSSEAIKWVGWVAAEIRERQRREDLLNQVTCHYKSKNALVPHGLAFETTRGLQKRLESLHCYA